MLRTCFFVHFASRSQKLWTCFFIYSKRLKGAFLCPILAGSSFFYLYCFKFWQNSLHPLPLIQTEKARESSRELKIYNNCEKFESTQWCDIVAHVPVLRVSVTAWLQPIRCVESGTYLRHAVVSAIKRQSALSTAKI